MADSPKAPKGPPDSAYAGFQREDLLRYARHFVLPHVGPEGQRALSNAKVLLVGAGGLGSPVASYLGAAGVGTLGVVDPDLVDLSNLQRQVLHGISQLGQYKVDSARDRLWDINPNVEVVGHKVRLTSENALEIIGAYDLVVDGSDNFPTRYLVSDACVFLGRPYVYGAVDRWEGQVSVFGLGEGPCYRCLFREPPPPGLVPTCAEAGVLGVLPGIIGSLQAAEAIKLILGVGTPLAGRLLIFDALDLSFREVRLRANPRCSVCGEEPTLTELVDYDLFCGVEPDSGPALRKPVPQVTPADLERRLEAGPRPFLLDVREPYEWEIGNLGHEGAVLVPYAEILNRLEELPKDRTIAVYCHVGVRSALIVQELMTKGFSDVLNLKGGYLAWVDQVDPGLPRY
ncbi:MAG: molybdopterin-synthase adenylyltransferase MoeB [Gemmatimonadetes bacterium]|nr:molybdopterin-synthase adenylyltransferase MoeB [Gemmatimonadota bacterium]NNM05348.1 molybdopterin-synthase adenylyltransferase MoeB [Gemmatimonadota bacterium]